MSLTIFNKNIHQPTICCSSSSLPSTYPVTFSCKSGARNTFGAVGNGPIPAGSPQSRKLSTSNFQKFYFWKFLENFFSTSRIFTEAIHLGPRLEDWSPFQRLRGLELTLRPSSARERHKEKWQNKQQEQSPLCKLY